MNKCGWLAIGFALVLAGTSDRGFGQGGVSAVTDEQVRSTSPGHPWQGFVPGMNPYSLSKQTTLSLMGWEARGGLPVLFALHHNSQAVCSSAFLGAKWSHSYDTHLDFWTDANATRQAALVWGNHRVQRFAFLNNQWMPLDGYREQLQVSGAGYVVILKSQISLEFEVSTFPGRYRLARISDPNGNVLTFDYRARDRLREVKDPSGRALRLMYSRGEKLTSIEFEVEGDRRFSRVWKLEYDSDQLARVFYPPLAAGANMQTFSAQFAYNGNNNITAFTDRAGKVWQYGYDGDRLSFVQPPGNTPQQRALYTRADPLRTLTDPSGVSINLTYDTAGRLAWVTDGLQNPTSTLGLTRPNAVIDGLGRRTNLLRDAWGRLLMKDYAIDPDAQYSYDALSRLVRMVDGSGTTSWTYDANGWLRQEASGIHQAQYDYHPNGLRARLTSIHNLGVLTLEYSYDGANRPAVLNQNRHYSG